MTAPVQPGDRWGIWIVDLTNDRPRVRTAHADEDPYIGPLAVAADAAHRLAAITPVFVDLDDDGAKEAADSLVADAFDAAHAWYRTVRPGAFAA